MAGDFTLDTKVLDQALKKSPQAASKGAATALKEIKDDWQADSVDIAPLKAGSLRIGINGEVVNPGASGRVEIHANATRSGFNYAYYIHEDAGKAVSGEKKFLDKPAEENIDKWTEWLEQEVARELRKVGW